MKKDLAERLYKRLKELCNDLPKAENGTYRGYLNVEVGNNFREILEFLKKEKTELEYLKEEEIDKKIKNLFSLLPLSKSGKISGYINVNAGREIRDFINELITIEIIPSIDSQEKIRIDEIARSALISNSLFSPNSPKRKISEACHSVNKDSYNKDLLLGISDVNLQGLEGITLLTKAVQQQNQVLITHLIDDRKADIDVRNIDFTTPLHYAISSDNVDMVDFLLQKNADPQAYAPEPEKINTPLACAFEQGNEKIIKILLEKIRANNTNDEEINDLNDLAKQFDKLNLLKEVGLLKANFSKTTNLN